MRDDVMTAVQKPLVGGAQELAFDLFRYDQPRLAHARGAAMRSQRACDALRLEEPEAVVAAAWLHDIGHLTDLAHTGFHPLDGALFLASQDWPDRTVFLVAHHSHSSLLAPHFGVEHHLAVLDHVPGLADDVITFADMTSGSDGLGTEPRARIAAMRVLDSGGSRVPLDVREGRYRLLLAATARIEATMRARRTTA
jgi:hypothetical protein